jgi:hypothetical protein
MSITYSSILRRPHMNNKHHRIIGSAVAALIFITALLAGCSYTALPNNVPRSAGYDELSLKNISVIIINTEKNGSIEEILTDQGEPSGFQANRQLWSKKLVESLASELARRGAMVRSNAPVKLSIALPEITMLQTTNLYQFNVKVLVVSSKGWSKTYEGVAGGDINSVWSVTSAAAQWSGQALAEVIKAMMHDREFLAALGK